MQQLLLCMLLIAFQFCHSQASKDMWYPRYHLAPLNGFMNDPNGLIYFGGYYHAFYQHSPNNVSASGLKHWGHARSKNMLSWEHLDEALTPSIPEDIDGCFSGSAIAEEDTLLLMYTGVSTVNNTSRQVQCLASSTDGGIKFDKEGTILESDVYSENFRDPKVWKQDDAYYVVLGTMNGTRGQGVLYKSEDLTDWKLNTIIGPIENTGYMWECPDLFTLEKKQILAFSYIETLNGSDHWVTGYIVGSWKPGHSFHIEHNFTQTDKGHDFYATQTFLAKDGRRILVAWMDMWDTPHPEAVHNWVGMFSLPRELSLNKKGNLIMNPIREVELLRTSLLSESNLYLSEEQEVFEIHTSGNLSHELELEWHLPHCNATEFGVQIAGHPENEGFFLFVNRTSGELVSRRSYPKVGFPQSDRSIKIDLNSPLHTRIFFDSSSVEVFVNHGQATLSSRIYPSATQKNVSLFTRGGDVLFANYRKWNILI